jgi:uncharacterized protein (TIGR03083 family)
MSNLSYEEMLFWIDDSAAALRASAADAGLTASVPGCPDWAVHDLVAHLGGVHLFWAAVVAAGPAEAPPDGVDEEPHDDLFKWSADATAALVGALRQAPPERGCWAWWESSGAPMTAGAVARHQVHEAAVHAFDAQQAAGALGALPTAVAADGVGEYLTVELPTNGPWPHDPASVRFETAAGGSWLVDLGPGGAQVAEGDGPSGAVPAATVTADPADMMLAFYRRKPHELRIDGDADLVTRLLSWPNLD